MADQHKLTLSQTTIPEDEAAIYQCISALTGKTHTPEFWQNVSNFLNGKGTPPNEFEEQLEWLFYDIAKLYKTIPKAQAEQLKETGTIRNYDMIAGFLLVKMQENLPDTPLKRQMSCTLLSKVIEHFAAVEYKAVTQGAVNRLTLAREGIANLGDVETACCIKMMQAKQFYIDASCPLPKLCGYIKTVCRNLLNDALSKQSSSKTLISLDQPSQAAADPTDKPLYETLEVKQKDAGAVLIESEFREGLGRHLQKLPKPQQQIIQLSYIDELPYDKIAEQLEIPLGTVKSRLNRARENLHRSIQRDPRMRDYLGNDGSPLLR